MRALVVSLALMTGAAGLAGCSSNQNAPAMQAMENPANSCGPGGSADIEDCNSRGGGRR